METKIHNERAVVIPSSVRKKLGIKGGTRFHVELDEENGR
jgi:AbrB family looped-hinge helix DNA binding protein